MIRYNRANETIEIYQERQGQFKVASENLWMRDYLAIKRVTTLTSLNTLNNSAGVAQWLNNNVDRNPVEHFFYFRSYNLRIV